MFERLGFKYFLDGKPPSPLLTVAGFARSKAPPLDNPGYATLCPLDWNIPGCYLG